MCSKKSQPEGGSATLNDCHAPDLTGERLKAPTANPAPAESVTGDGTLGEHQPPRQAGGTGPCDAGAARALLQSQGHPRAQQRSPCHLAAQAGGRDQAGPRLRAARELFTGLHGYDHVVISLESLDRIKVGTTN